MVYFDNAATTPVPKAVADAMYEVLTAHFGNPSSQYPIGVEMKKAVEGWRAVIAGALGCPAERLYFTSCGTESDNWAIQAALWQNRHVGKHIITTTVEHSAVLEPCKLLAQQGYEVTYLKPGRDGNVTAEQVADVVIAYEPVWAIGTGLTATDEQANETIGVIRKAVARKYGQECADKVRIQYGGSMNPKNVKGLMAQPEIDGGLIGGASLKAPDFSLVVNYDK